MIGAYTQLTSVACYITANNLAREFLGHECAAGLREEITPVTTQLAHQLSCEAYN